MKTHHAFIALWQTTPKPETQQLLHGLERHNHMHRHFKRILAAILTVVSLLLVCEEASGRLATRGWLSVIWLLCLSIGGFWQWRIRSRRAAVREQDTVNLLKQMIRQAKTDLLLARSLYAGVPLGAVLGYLVMEFAGIHQSFPGTLHPQLRLVTGIGIAILVTMVVAGVVLARSRHRQVLELTEKLDLINSDW